MTRYTTAHHAPYSEVPSPFVMEEATFRQLGSHLIELAVTYLENLDTSPCTVPCQSRSAGSCVPCPYPAQAAPPRRFSPSFSSTFFPGVVSRIAAASARLLILRRADCQCLPPFWRGPQQ